MANIAFRLVTGLILVVFMKTATAGIIDTSADSFIDTDTGLEWMDFGVNNHQSYQQVNDELNSTWAGWSLATENQALTMWSNAFSGQGSDRDNEYKSGTWYASYSDKVAGPTYLSVHEDTFDIMNSNYTSAKFDLSYGLFADNTDSLSYLYFIDRANKDDLVYAYGRDIDLDSFANHPSSLFSTMLVRTAPVASVPEPGTLILLGLGLAGLGAARRQQAKR